MALTDAILRAEVEKLYNSLQDQPQHSAEQAITVKRIIELHLVAFKYYDFERTKLLVDPNYKQHSIFVGDGRESLIDMAKIMEKWAETKWTEPGKPHIKMDIKRILVDGPYVVVQHHSQRWEGDIGNHVIDIYRVKDEKFTEHWESVMDVVPESELKHENGQF